MGKNTINTLKTSLLEGCFMFWKKQQHHVSDKKVKAAQRKKPLDW